jgi:AraC family transcriptional regulator, arabinose operon regulatory protein
MKAETILGSHENIWYGFGRKRIEIPKSIIKSKISRIPLLKQLHIKSIGYYPKAKDHFTYREKGIGDCFLFYCVDGEGWYKINNQQYQVKANQFFILPQNIKHSYGSSEKHPWTIYWTHFGGESLPQLSKVPAFEQNFKPGLVRNNGDILPLFEKIYKTLELGYSIENLLFANMCLSQFITLFIFNTKHYEQTMLDQTDFIDNAILYMQENVVKNITLVDLSKKFNYSVSRFSNLFKQKTGYAPIDYFLQMKMQKACQMLDFTNDPIKNIAYNMGFDDPYYFSKRFRTVIGMSPKKYRSLKKTD